MGTALPLLAAVALMAPGAHGRARPVACDDPPRVRTAPAKLEPLRPARPTAAQRVMPGLY